MSYSKRNRRLDIQGVNLKLFVTTKSKDMKREYSTYIEVDEKGEVVNYGCTCIYSSFYTWTKKNKYGTKPCWHIQQLAEKFKKIKEGKNEDI